MTIDFVGVAERSEIKLVGSAILCTTDERQNYAAAQTLWRRFNAQLPWVENRTNAAQWQKFGLYDKRSDKTFAYMACVPVSEFGQMPSGFAQKTIAPFTYLVFRHTGGTADIYSSVRKIYRELLPNLGVQAADKSAAGFNHYEEYGRDFQWSKPDSALRIWVPVGASFVVNELKTKCSFDV